MRLLAKRALVLGLAVLFSLFAAGCSNLLNSGGGGGGGDNGDDNGDVTDPGGDGPGSGDQATDISDVVSVNLSGAQALVTRSSELENQGLRPGSIGTSDTQTSPLAKILEDGSVEDVFQVADENMHFPPITFVAVGPEGSIYVHFDWALEVWNEGHEPELRAQFIEITPDESVYVIEEEGWIREFNWNWGAGRNQKPVVFDDDGGIYYVLDENGSAVLKRYADGETKELTAAGEIDIQAFFTDGTDLFFLGQNNTQDNNAIYLRKVTRDGATQNIFYKASGDGTWIRAVEQTSDGLILHGEGIPNPDDANITYSGLLRLTQQSGGTYSWETVIGYSSDGSTGGTNNEIRYLEESVFQDQNGDIDYAVLDAIARRFFSNGEVPAGIDYFADVEMDYDDPLHEDLHYSNESYFWYRLLESYAGFDPGFFDWFTHGGPFGENEARLYNLLLETKYTERATIENADDLLLEIQQELNDDFGSGFDPYTEISWKVTPEGDSYDPATDFLDGPFENKPVEWEWESDDTSQTFPYTGPLGNYRVLDDSASEQKWAFANLIDGIPTGPDEIGYGELDDIFLSDNGSYLIDTNYINTLDRLIEKAEGGTNMSGLTLKSNDAGETLWSLNDQPLDSDERYYDIEWEFEGDGTETYDRQGVLGNYRLLDSQYNQAYFVTNFFNVEEFGLQEFYIDAWSLTESVQIVRLAPEFLDDGGAVKATEVDDVLSRFTASASYPDDLAAMVLDREDYEVTDSDGNVDTLATDNALLQAFFEYEPLPEFPTAVSHGNFSEYTTNPWEHSSDGGYDFHSLDRFTVSDTTGEIIGMFRQGDYNSNVFSLVRLMDESGNIVEEEIKTDIQTSSLKMVGAELYYTETDPAGNWRLLSSDLETGSSDQELIGYGEQLELFKYDIALPLNRIYFTAGSNAQAGTSLIGTVDLLTGEVSYEESAAGVSSSSDLTVYTAQ